MAGCLALDFGASSIRLIGVSLADGRFALRELARFANGPQLVSGQLVWAYEGIFAKIEAALGNAGASGERYDSIGADSWGVDYVLLDAAGNLIGAPVAYRDARTEGEVERYLAGSMSAHDLFAATGLPCLPFNTLFQLSAQTRIEPSVLARARRLLFTADYVHFWLSGVAANERTLASTSQMLTLDGRWWPAVLETLALSPSALSKPVAPGTILGPLRPELMTRSGLRDVEVIAPASHDTESAIAAIPAFADHEWAYISCGTWSIIGVESDVPSCGTSAESAGLGNESGVDGTYCVQSTVTGLWIVQEIQRLLDERSDGGTLMEQARHIPAFRSLINPADPRFFNPPDMIAEIRAACRETRELPPETPAELVRCAYDSLALLYHTTLTKLTKVTGRCFERLHMVGGGSKASLLNQLCAGATGLPVLAGPAEATAIGNALVQFVAKGEVESIARGRRLIRDSFPPVIAEPSPLPGLEDAVARFDRLTG